MKRPERVPAPHSRGRTYPGLLRAIPRSDHRCVYEQLCSTSTTHRVHPAEWPSRQSFTDSFRRNNRGTSGARPVPSQQTALYQEFAAAALRSRFRRRTLFCPKSHTHRIMGSCPRRCGRAESKFRTTTNSMCPESHSFTARHIPAGRLTGQMLRRTSQYSPVRERSDRDHPISST